MVLVRHREPKSKIARDDELMAVIVMASDTRNLVEVAALVLRQFGKVTSVAAIHRFLSSPSNPVLRSLKTASNWDEVRPVPSPIREVPLFPT